MNFGYNDQCKDWKEDRKELLAAKLCKALKILPF
jgi:hypothetical protein